MSYINLRCKTCGGNMSFDLHSKNILCTHCGKNYIVSELLDDKDIRVIDKLSDIELSHKISANTYIKEGDSYIYQANFEKAEQAYKKAIEIDELNYRAYLGVVRAKTHNLNIIPENDDYRYYAKKAIDYVDIDNKEYVKNELSKLILLRNEKKLREKHLQTEVKKYYKETAAKKYQKLFGKISGAIVLAVTAIILTLVFIGI